jgi:[acyl-carrier-protein] S-malonyltransferase
MCQALFAASPAVLSSVFDQARAALDLDVRALILHGPAETLNRTEHAQPAILACSVAGFLAQTQYRPVGFVGHSLGEYSALVASGALELGDALRLVRTRGRLMQAACDAWGRKPAMAAMHNLPLQEALALAEACPAGWTCEVACSNGPSQTVLGGCEPGVAWAVARAKERGRVRAVWLPVSAPFHTSVMRPAASLFAKELEAVCVSAPRLPVVFNATATALASEAEIKQALVAGITMRVQWAECMAHMAALTSPSTAVVEVGGSTLLRFGLPSGLVAAGPVAVF